MPFNLQVGTWESGTGANFSRNYTEQYSEIVESLHNKTLIVTCILVTFTIGTAEKKKLFAENFFKSSTPTPCFFTVNPDICRQGVDPPALKTCSQNFYKSIALFYKFFKTMY